MLNLCTCQRSSCKSKFPRRELDFCSHSEKCSIFFAHFSLPMNQNTFFGYFVGMFLTMVCLEAYHIVRGSTILLLISICLHHRAFFEMFQCSIQELDRHQNDPCDEQRSNCKQIISKQIQFYEWTNS